MKLPRMSGWIVITAALVFGIWWLAQPQLQVIMYKLGLVTIAMVISYWFDRSMFARLTDRLEGQVTRDVVSAARVLARAIIYLATVLGLTLGV